MRHRRRAVLLPDLSVIDGCETPWVNAAAVAGKIALVYRGTCGFAVKAKNAQLNGAAGVIIGNHTAGGNVAPNMAGADPTVTIPVFSDGNADAEAIRSQLASTTVNATLSRGQFGPTPRRGGSSKGRHRCGLDGCAA